MRENRKTQMFELAMCIALLVSAVVFTRDYVQTRDRLIAEWYPVEVYGFSTEYGFGEDSVWLDSEELAEYQAVTDEYNSGVCYELLSPEEQIVYNAFEYAWDNNYNYIYVVDDAGYKDGRDITDIVTLLSSDSPLLQQNVDYKLWETDMTFSEAIMGELAEKKIAGTIIEVDNFTMERTETVLTAVEEAKKIKLDFSEATTDAQKARVIYDYVVKNVEYSEDELSSAYHEADQLYDAVVEKETICDGFSNMYSLLCNMNGIRCYEKVYDPDIIEPKNTTDNGEDKESPAEEDKTPQNTGEGHTWCVVMLDGKWYNVDATVTQSNDEDTMWLDFKFGFSDDMQLYENYLDGALPECQMCLYDNYLVVEGYDDFVSVVGDAVLEAEDNELYVCVKNTEKGDTSYKSYFQEMAYYTGSSVYSSTIDSGYVHLHHIELR